MSWVFRVGLLSILLGAVVAATDTCILFFPQWGTVANPNAMSFVDLTPARSVVSVYCYH